MAEPLSDAPLRDRVIVLMGGDGFVGRHVAQVLLAAGARVRVASRRVEKAWRVKPLGGLGQTQFARVDIAGDPARLAVLCEGADAVVNLVGAFGGDLDAVHVRGAGALAKAAAEAGARAFVQVSAIGADAGSSVAYARTKAGGEAAVLAAFPGATVLRPSVLFGPDDNFLNMFGGLIALTGDMPVPVPFPVFAPEAKLQPLFVDDAAEAIAAVIVATLAGSAVHAGRTYEIAGPEVVTMLALVRAIAAAAGRKPLLVPLPDAVGAVLAAMPGVPISSAQFKLLVAGNVAGGALPGMAELGLRAKPLELFLDRWMVRFRRNGRFGVGGQFAA